MPKSIDHECSLIIDARVKDPRRIPLLMSALGTKSNRSRLFTEGGKLPDDRILDSEEGSSPHEVHTIDDWLKNKPNPIDSYLECSTGREN